LSQLRDAQLQGAEAGIERALAKAVPPGGALRVSLVTPGADQPLDVVSIRICSTASATDRRKSPSPAFWSSSTSGNLSSVIGSLFGLG
jgi:hypothetical protein